MNALFDPTLERDACGVGFVARLSGVPSHQVVTDALTAMARLAHRGGHGAGDNCGDGAGLLLPLPRAFFTRQWPLLARADDEQWVVGQLFLPRLPDLRAKVMDIVKESLASCGFSLLDGRELPVCPEVLGTVVRNAMPFMAQILVRAEGHEDAALTGEYLERRLYVARRVMEKAVLAHMREGGHDARQFYVVSLSARSIIYKGMLPGARLGDLYPDLVDPVFAAPFAVFHERFSTNTLPSWRLAQPFRLIAHNGEINTLNGNVGRMRCRESRMESSVFGEDLEKLLPVVDEYGSDSAKFDNTLELLVRCGRSLPHALMMMVPEPFGPAFVMGDNKRAFYEYHAALMDPWDGPTAMVFTDGYRRVGALLDRNGLRPCRYSVTRDGLVVLASETGVMDVDPERLLQRGQLRPRRMLMVDVQRHRLVPDPEIKGQVIREQPYRRWLKQHAIQLQDIVQDEWDEHQVEAAPPCDLACQSRVFGYDDKVLRAQLLPMARDAQEPVGAMGMDRPLAVFSENAPLLFDFFKQQFAQVTNPSIDPLREELSMSLMNFAGRERNLLEPGPEHCATLRLPHPFLDRGDMRRLRATRRPQVRLHTLDATFAAGSGGAGLEEALTRMHVEAERALQDGATILVISDAACGQGEDPQGGGRMPIPSLLALSSVHHHLQRKEMRHLCGLFVETGEAHEVMHMAQLSAYGASAICPYVAMDMVQDMARQGRIPGKLPHEALASYVAALKKGMLKAFARLGISTQRSFRGGQFFEAVGINRTVIDRHFTGTVSRVGGIGMDEIAADVQQRFDRARCAPAAAEAAGETGTRQREQHLWSPESVRLLHKAVRDNDAGAYAAYTRCSDVQNGPVTLRSLVRIKPEALKPIPLDEVEPASSIVRRFVGAAMSLGSISAEAHETLAMGCNLAGAVSNCGEGGEDPARNHPAPGDHGHKLDRRSHVRQIASGRFGVTTDYVVHADELQIKIAQGAKPGEGGQLPSHKVTAEIARLRGTMPGVSLVSPPPHHDIYSIEDLAQLVFDLQRVKPGVRVSVKLVAQAGVGTVAVGVAKAGAHTVLISGHDGGTGASPLSAIEHTGLPWEMGLVETQHALTANGLRHTVRLQVDGQMRTGRDVLMAILLGAEEFGFGSALLVSLGCVMCRKCHLDRCPVGIGTQAPDRRALFLGRPEHVLRFLYLVAEDLRRHMAEIGFTSVDQMVGRADLLERTPDPVLPRAAMLDFAVFRGASTGLLGQRHGTPRLDPPSDSLLETALLERARPLLQGKTTRCTYNGTVMNTDRAVGARLAGEMIRVLKGRRLPQHSLCLRLWGSAGQSCGAFLTPGITLKVRGDANDYVGKSLSGGIIVVAPAPEAEFVAAEQAVVGNVALYGATSGEGYFCGTAGERFAVRNSGAVAVVEGVGDHGCEYMTGGTVVVLGQCGHNFAAGMSGGVAFVYDSDERFQNRCNTDSVDLESVWTAEDRGLLRSLIEQHAHYTGSRKAEALLKNWEAELPLFVKVMPLDYREALERQRGADRHGGDTASATEEVFVRDMGEAE